MSINGITYDVWQASFFLKLALQGPHCSMCSWECDRPHQMVHDGCLPTMHSPVDGGHAWPVGVTNHVVKRTSCQEAERKLKKMKEITNKEYHLML